ncbi:unnamed protein product [Psylliodes chrysocephalus]|uniref:Uncharacterized protein n=1 Tax=Psylliodes chrysocephalus TaxID=3402493 RepID=A0A9P0D7Q2_9CUCU|nr:unnamed protein product [Psylliodes chrysocephala]
MKMQNCVCDIAAIRGEEVNKPQEENVPEDIDSMEIETNPTPVKSKCKKNRKRRKGRLEKMCATANYKTFDKLLENALNDTIFAVSNVKILPHKNINLGSIIISLTNSAKHVKVLHRFGHICSYDVLEELETEATYSCMQASNVCPSTVITKKGLHCCAFDNFDRFIESASNKTTLNDTVGIVYQDIIKNEGCDVIEERNDEIKN